MRRAPLHAAHRRAGPRLGLPKRGASLRIHGVVDAALLAGADDRPGDALAVGVGDELGRGGEVVVGPGAARAVLEGRKEAADVPVVAAVHDAVLLPGDEMAAPADDAGAGLQREDGIDVVVRAVAAGLRAAGGHALPVGDARRAGRGVVCRVAVVVAGARIDQVAIHVDREIAAPHAGAAVADRRGVGLPLDLALGGVHGDHAAAGLAAGIVGRAGNTLLARGTIGFR